MMRSQFEEKLTVDAAGKVDAKGTFEWGADEEKAVVEVSILQETESGQLVKSASGKAVFTRAEHPEGWSLAANSEPPPNQLNTGKAVAAGIVCALGEEIEMSEFVWSQPVQLK